MNFRRAIWILHIYLSENEIPKTELAEFFLTIIQFSSVRFLRDVWLFATPWTAVHQASLSITSSWHLLKLTSIESVMPSNYLILCGPLLLPSIFPGIRVFSNESICPVNYFWIWPFVFTMRLKDQWLPFCRLSTPWSVCAPLPIYLFECIGS